MARRWQAQLRAVLPPPSKLLHGSIESSRRAVRIQAHMISLYDVLTVKALYDVEASIAVLEAGQPIVKWRDEEEHNSLSARRQPGCSQALHLAVALREAAAAGAAGVRLQAFPGGDDLRHPTGILSGNSDERIQSNDIQRTLTLRHSAQRLVRSWSHTPLAL
jgi:hypothetical protein